MSQVLQFAILGLGIGAVYALLGNGLVLIYRGSGILNFAQGAYAMVGAYLFYELHDLHRQAFAPSFAIAAVTVGLVGALTHLLVMRPLRHASPLARLIATLGILAILQGAATIRYGANLIEVPSSLPQRGHPLGQHRLLRGPPLPAWYRRCPDRVPVGGDPVHHAGPGLVGGGREPACRRRPRLVA
jgi:branched-subunit amino acid ABC-type transport system permease component